MIKYTDEILAKIEQYAYDLMTWKDIVYLIGEDVETFKIEIEDRTSPVHLAYHKGKIKRKLKLRQPILKMAEMGSPQAELLAVQFLKDQEISETDE